MKYRVEHKTRVVYTPPANVARFNLRLQPIEWPDQTLENYVLQITPRPAIVETRQSPFPSKLARIIIDQPITQLEIRSRFTVSKHAAVNKIDKPSFTVAELSDISRSYPEIGTLAPTTYLYPSPLLSRNVEIERWARTYLHSHAHAIEGSLQFAKLIQREFKYLPGSTAPDTSIDHIFATRKGVCQDFAHLMILALRSVGLPAAYISGYLRTDPPPGSERLIGVDAMHAWIGLWCGPDKGWLGIDPTNGCLAESDHVVTAMGRDYSDVSPLDGTMVGGNSQRVQTAVDVAPVDVV